MKSNFTLLSFENNSITKTTAARYEQNSFHLRPYYLVNILRMHFGQETSFTSFICLVKLHFNTRLFSFFKDFLLKMWVKQKLHSNFYNILQNFILPKNIMLMYIKISNSIKLQLYSSHIINVLLTIEKYMIQQFFNYVALIYRY